MLLTGKYFRSLDDKGRTPLPKPLRDALGHPDRGLLYLAPGSDGSLTAYPEDTFATFADQLAQRSPTQQDVRDFGRLFYAQVQPVEIDRQGRIRIPSDLVQLAQLTKEIVLLGVRDHLEIWNVSRWENYLAEKSLRFDQIAENAFKNPLKEVNRSPDEVDVRPTQPR
ncbi:division/cell wall cluster transcriptional repressor MraZ [Lignipirellula cremea]|uniref:Transcriptional regulator MraZ n=1 Tax=Lignipirellula cremea TaxID=2528010 RepID=A0A518E175_9BACT|nr:division/cell wall cluster transcriptional repressor MraZ [Lignipirellula cremea]QDU97857.1 Transcriptional regulator MraZ [Lignipirellula cremea]